MNERHHNAYVEPVGGGYHGYQAKCWDCDWVGAWYPRGDEPLGTEESREHKRNARREAAEHRASMIVDTPPSAVSLLRARADEYDQLAELKFGFVAAELRRVADELEAA